MFDPFGAIETLRSLAESDSQIRAVGGIRIAHRYPRVHRTSFPTVMRSFSSGIWNGQNRPTIPPCWHPGLADW